MLAEQVGCRTQGFPSRRAEIKKPPEGGFQVSSYRRAGTKPAARSERVTQADVDAVRAAVDVRWAADRAQAAGAERTGRLRCAATVRHMRVVAIHRSALAQVVDVADRPLAGARIGR